MNRISEITGFDYIRASSSDIRTASVFTNQPSSLLPRPAILGFGNYL